MGAWGIGTFENDDALDWVYDYEAAGAATVSSAFAEFRAAIDAGYADADLGAAVMVAGEAVAAAFGAPLKDLHPELLIDLLTHKTEVKKVPNIHQEASQSVSDAVSLSEKSELAALWAEAGKLDALQKVGAELISRIEEAK